MNLIKVAAVVGGFKLTEYASDRLIQRYKDNLPEWVVKYGPTAIGLAATVLTAGIYTKYWKGETPALSNANSLTLPLANGSLTKEAVQTLSLKLTNEQVKQIIDGKGMELLAQVRPDTIVQYLEENYYYKMLRTDFRGDGVYDLQTSLKEYFEVISVSTQDAKYTLGQYFQHILNNHGQLNQFNSEIKEHGLQCVKIDDNLYQVLLTGLEVASFAL